MTLTISLPADAEPKLRERATAAGQDVTQYVEELVAREIAAPKAQSTATASSLDDEYQRAYEEMPEEIDDVIAMLPYLAVEPEEWE